MKLKSILLLVAVALCLSFSFKEKHFPFDHVNIRAAAYQDGHNLPVLCDSFNLVVLHMADGEPFEDVIQGKKVYTVTDGALTFFPDSGRYTIIASKDTLKDAVELVFHEGRLSLTLILQ